MAQTAPPIAEEQAAASRALAVVPAEQLLPSRQAAQAQLLAVRDFQATVRELFIPGHDFGSIPGMGTKPSLLKPGAEKLAKLLHCTDQYEILHQIEDWERPHFRYLVKCRLVHMYSGTVISEGLGECNSMEAKYRWRWVWPSDLTKEQRDALRQIPGRVRTVKTKRGETQQFRLENDDLYSQVNTILKMAKKRALVDAALSAGRLSDLFTQDLEDLSPAGVQDESEAAPSNEHASRERADTVAKEADPIWQRWLETRAEAQEIGGIEIPELTLPAKRKAVIEYGMQLRNAIEASRAEPTIADAAYEEGEFGEVGEEAPTDPPASRERRITASQRQSIVGHARRLHMTDLQLAGFIEHRYGGRKLDELSFDQAADCASYLIQTRAIDGAGVSDGPD